MQTMETILNRKSTRRFAEAPIPEAVRDQILRAGLAGPSAVNARPFAFLVVTKRETLCAMADANGHAADPLRTAALAVLICGDLTKAYPKAPDYWIVDGSIAAQNMILAAQEQGVGSVWLGTWPQEQKVAGPKALFSLPEHIVPHSIIAFGYPAEPLTPNTKERWEPDKIHFEQW